MNRCELCGRYVREHGYRKEGGPFFDRHTIAPFDPAWCAGSGRTLRDTVRLKRERATKDARS
jgi:hypothetical protein